MNNNPLKISILAMHLLASPILLGQMRAEIPSPEAISAYRQYWQTFEDYEAHTYELEKGKFLGSWEQIKHEWDYQDRKQSLQQLDILREAARRYQEHLERFPDANNAAYVKLNLAQILNQLGQLENEKDPNSGKTSKKEALAVLAKMEKDGLPSDLQEENLYLRASILESLDQTETARSLWQKLALQASSTIYGVHALIAMGDYHFKKEEAREALRSYQKARKLIEKVKPQDFDFELLRIQYRQSWAAYRSADLETCLQIAQEVLEPGRDFRQNSVRLKAIQDSTELLADTLFERNDMTTTKAVLNRPLIRPFAGAIGLRMMMNLSSYATPDRMIELGEHLVDQVPQSKEIPEILTLLADSYKRQNKEENYLITLERLALLLPAKSLWRNQHRESPQDLKKMEEKALAANKILASHYYEQGLVQGKSVFYQSAYSYYQTLLSFSPLHEDSEQWQIRSANSLFFAGKYNEADLAYERFKNRGTISPLNLELAFYQQTLSREKSWRQSLQKVTELKGDPTKNPIVIEKLRKLEQAIDGFADRFPNRQHSVDLLLLAASANRDVNSLAQAEKYWNRALLSEPTPTQKTLALRGLVQSKIQANDPKQVLELTRTYLKLEGKRDLSPGFSSEMKGVLAAASKEYSDKLNKQGQVEEAGRVLLSVSQEFPDIPDQESLYRDGAYYLALAGEWNQAQKSAERYLSSGLKQKEADMIYLKAKAQEYQLRFSASSQTYIQLAERFPKYSRTVKSLERAEMLAASEEDYSLAAKAATISLNLQKDRGEKRDTQTRIAEYYLKENSYEKASIHLRNAEKLASGQSERLETKLLLGKTLAQEGRSEEAQTIFRDITRETLSKKDTMDPSAFRAITGEAYFLLASKAQEEFESIDITGPSARLEQAWPQKMELLETALNNYNKAIQTESPEWAGRSRYAAGDISEKMAVSSKNLAAKVTQNINGKTPESFKIQSERWEKLSKEYYGQNILAKNREPDQYRNSIWVERSAMKVVGAKPSKPVMDPDGEVPSAMAVSQPYQWSH